jgi:hypothetical protein
LLSYRSLIHAEMARSSGNVTGLNADLLFGLDEAELSLGTSKAPTALGYVISRGQMRAEISINDARGSPGSGPKEHCLIAADSVPNVPRPSAWGTLSHLLCHTLDSAWQHVALSWQPYGRYACTAHTVKDGFWLQDQSQGRECKYVRQRAFVVSGLIIVSLPDSLLLL